MRSSWWIWSIFRNNEKVRAESVANIRRSFGWSEESHRKQIVGRMKNAGFGPNSLNCSRSNERSFEVFGWRSSTLTSGYRTTEGFWGCSFFPFALDGVWKEVPLNSRKLLGNRKIKMTTRLPNLTQSYRELFTFCANKRRENRRRIWCVLVF